MYSTLMLIAFAAAIQGGEGEEILLQASQKGIDKRWEVFRKYSICTIVGNFFQDTLGKGGGSNKRPST